MKTQHFDEKIATNVETKEVRLHALSRDNHIISRQSHNLTHRALSAAGDSSSLKSKEGRASQAARTMRNVSCPLSALAGITLRV